jgi:hypothetical protein
VRIEGGRWCACGWQMRRDPSLLAAQLGLTCAVALVVGGIFYNLTFDLEVSCRCGRCVSAVGWHLLCL